MSSKNSGNHSEKFDWLVMGSGPAGQRAAVQAAKVKKKVLIIEKDSWGGACVHTGTIPSKTLREAALANELRLDNAWNKLLQKKNRVVQAETEIISHQLDRNGVKRISGEATFLSKNEIEVGKERFSADKILIAVGTRPCRQVEFPWGKGPLFDSDSILELNFLPKSLLVVGAGVIGCEYASIFAKLGVAVTLSDRRKELLRSVDSEIVESLAKHFEAMGIKVLLNCEHQNILAKGPQEMEVTLSGKAQKFNAVLICMGREGNTDKLGLEKAGLKAAARGQMEVNKFYQTAQPHIYAAGDIIGPPALAASSSEQGRLAACHAFEIENSSFPELFPYGIYTIPEISSVGMQEADLKEKKIDYVVGRAKYKELARGQILGDEHGLLKLLVSKSDRRILGVHILGTGATELIHIGQTAMSFDAKIDFFVRNVFNYPTLAEAYKVAALNANNLL